MFSFYKNNVYKHMKAQIQFNFFCFLKNKLVLENNKYTKRKSLSWISIFKAISFLFSGLPIRRRLLCE